MQNSEVAMLDAEQRDEERRRGQPDHGDPRGTGEAGDEVPRESHGVTPGIRWSRTRGGG